MVADGRMHPRWFSTRRDVNVLLRSGRGEAEVELERLRQLASGNDPFPYWHIMGKTIVDALGSQGRIDEAGELLLLLHEAGVVLAYDRLLLVPGNAWIRDDPELERVVAQSRNQFEETLTILEEARSRGELPGYLDQTLRELAAELDMS